MVKAHPRKTQPNPHYTSREGRKLDPSWNSTSRQWQDVIWLSVNSYSLVFRALICKLICGWQRQTRVWKRILDVIRCLTTSSFVDWGLIGNEWAAFPLWCKQKDEGNHTNHKFTKNIKLTFITLTLTWLYIIVRQEDLS